MTDDGGKVEGPQALNKVGNGGLSPYPAEVGNGEGLSPYSADQRVSGALYATRRGSKMNWVHF